MTDDLVQRLRTELLEWLDKTKWVQQTCQTHELGLHRADILRNRIEAFTAENERLNKSAACLAETEATQEGGWKEAGHPWLWTYDPHLKEKKP